MGMKEIGGYLCSEKYRLPIRHENAIALNSGRNCLAYLILKKNIKKIYIPKFLCSSVGDVCRKYNVDIEYYNIGPDLMPLIKRVDDDWMYIVNYYGQLSNKTLYELKTRFNHIIVDNVHSYFQEPCDGVDTIYSCRKFFGVPDGAFLYSDLTVDESIEIDYSWNRVEHIFGSFEYGASKFYSSYASSEEEFNNVPLKRMSKLTDNFLHAIDYEYVKKCRYDNFCYLHSRLHQSNKLDLITPDGPYMYPFYINNGGYLRKQLQKINIYIPILWPDVYSLCCENDLEYDMATNILPLPIDQRYKIDDMEYLVDNILQLLPEHK